MDKRILAVAGALAASVALEPAQSVDIGYRQPKWGRNRDKNKAGARHKRNPAGTKMVMRFFKAKQGAKANTVAEAWAWYRIYLDDMDKAARKREAERKAARAARRNQPLAEAA
jgi:hypothetical protein